MNDFKLWFLTTAAFILFAAPCSAQGSSGSSITLPQTDTGVATSPSMDQTDKMQPYSPSSVISNGISSSAYVLGPGDILTVTVQPQSKYSVTELSVGQDGTVEYPRLGTIDVTGLTLSELREQLTTDLDKFCIGPDVEVQVTAERPQVVYVTGGVRTPKILDVRAAPNVAKAITLADGAVDNNELAHVAVFRDGKIIPANVYNVLVNGVDTGQNVDLMPGDLIVVPMNTAKFAVVGAVTTPGVYPLGQPGGNEGQTRLMDAITAAGGTTRTGANVHNVEVVRTMPDGSTKTAIYDYGKFVKEADETQNPVIDDKDLVFVPDSRHTFSPLDTLGYLSYFAILKGL